MTGLNACERQNLHDRSRGDDSTERGRDHQPSCQADGRGDRPMYLNVFVPGLQYEQGIVQFFRTHRGQPLPSAALMSPMTRGFVAKLEDFVTKHDIPLVQFESGSARTR